MPTALADAPRLVDLHEFDAVSEHDIQLGDYRQFLGNLGEGTVDLVLTDPPYSISRTTGFANVKNGVKRFAVSMDFGDWDHKQIDLASLSIGMYRALRTGGTAIVWYDVWKTSYLADSMSEAGFKMIRLIIWEKVNPVPLNSKATYLSGCREVAVVGVKGGCPVFHGSYDSGIYRHPIPRHNGHRIHPTQKPVDLFSELVSKHSNHEDLVVDPFLGGGTTAVVAKRLGRRFKGCDIDEGYVRAARERVRADG